MPRQRSRPINSFIQALMDEAGCATLKEYSEQSGIPYSTLLGYAETERTGAREVYKALLRNAQLAGKPVDEFLRGLLAS